MLTFIPLSSNLLNQPPGLDKFARASGEPIAFISNGDPIFSPFIFMMFPPHIIGVVNIILWLFIDIASAPAFFNSLTTFSKSISCIIKLLGSKTELESISLSAIVSIIPGPVTSVKPIILFPSFIWFLASSNSELFFVALSICSCNCESTFSVSFKRLSYFSLYFKTSALKLFSS